MGMFRFFACSSISRRTASRSGSTSYKYCSTFSPVISLIVSWKSDRLSRTHLEHFHAHPLDQLLQLRGFSLQRRERTEVHGDDRLRTEQLAGVRRFFRGHGELVADRQQHDLGMVKVVDDLHVAE